MQYLRRVLAERTAQLYNDVPVEGISCIALACIPAYGMHVLPPVGGQWCEMVRPIIGANLTSP
ncbi:MAG TPA: hypothetical protein VF772_16005 [Terriglobales bacterium]